MLQDVRYAFRRLRGSPAFTLMALACIVLGIGATTTIFSVFNTVLLRPLPFAEIDRLVMIWDTHAAPGAESQRFTSSPINFFARRAQAVSLVGIGGLTTWSFNLTAVGEPERIEGAYVTADLLPVLGVEPFIGRGILEEEDQPGAQADVVLMSHGLWSRRFGSERELLGGSVTLDGKSHTVVGILPPGFQFPFEAELWVPAKLDPGNLALGRNHFLATVARLRGGVTREQAQSELETIARWLEQENPEIHRGWGVEVTGFRDELIGDIRPKLLTLGAGVGFLLLITCANVACLLLARAAAEEGTLAIRSALGAGRGRLVRGLLAESTLLAALGGALGVVLAFASVKPLATLAPAITLPAFFQDIHIDLRVLAFSLLATLFSALSFGLVPAWRFSKPSLQPLLDATSHGAGGGRSHRLLSTLVVTEVALAVWLLIGAGLTMKSFQRLQAVDAGFHPENVLTSRIHLPVTSYPEGYLRTTFLEEVLRRIRALPEVVSAGATTTLPLSTIPRSASFTVEGRPLSSSSEVLIAPFRLISPGYLKAMEIGVLQGRDFTDLDHPEASGVALVSQEMARRYWPGLSPLGRRIKRGKPNSDRPWLTVVGVVEDLKDFGLETEVSPVWYLPYGQHASTTTAAGLSLAVRAASNPEAIAGAIRNAVWAVDKDQPVFGVATLEELVSDSIAQKRLGTLLLALFAAFGLILASVGIFGVISYVVGLRTQEIGVRKALGAQIGDIVGLVLRRGLILTLAGLAVGLVAALLFSKLLASELYGVSPTDSRIFLEISLFFIAIALVACYFPARRAARIDPVRAIRDDYNKHTKLN